MKKFIILFSIIFFFFSYTFSLKLTEVYFDGTNEFIWIYNETNNSFSGSVYISWAKSSNINLNLNIDLKKEIIVWDNIDNMLSGVQAYETWLWLSISDTKDINIQLLNENGQVIDTFYVSWTKVNNLNNKKTSFSKIYSGSKWIVENTKVFKNNNSNYKINPWYVFINSTTSNSKNNTGSNLRTCFLLLKEKKQNTFSFVYTWNFKTTDIDWYLNNKKIWTWQNMSISLQKWISNIKAVWKNWNNSCISFYSIYLDSIDNNNWKLKISEVHSKNDKFPEYIELKAYGNVSWDYEFINLWRWNSSITFPIKLYSWNLLLISKSYSWLVYTWNILLYSKMSLLDNGEKIIIRQNGQDIDNIDYKWNSAYFSSYSWTVRLFYKNSTPSPGYETYINKYAKWTNLNCYTKIQTKTTPFLSKDSINFITVVNGKEIQNSNTNFSCKYILSWQVLSNKCNPSSLKLNSGLLPIKLEVIDKNGQTCQNTYYLNLPKENIKTYTKNIEINTTNCITLSSTKLNDLVKLINNKYKSKTTLRKIFDPIKYIYTNQKPSIEKCLLLNSNELAELNYKISQKYKSSYTLNKIFSKVDFTKYKSSLPKIKAILPYPTSWDNEKIILYGHYMTGLSMQVWNKTVPLSNYSLSGQYLVFTWNFHIPNKNSCIWLRFFNNIIDYKCFENVKKWQIVRNFTDSNRFLFKNIKLVFTWDKIVVKNKIISKQFKNTKYIKYKTKVKKSLKKIAKLYNKKVSFINKLKKQINKLIDINVNRTSKYVLTLVRYRQLKKDCLIKNSKKYKLLKEKNYYIKLLKNQISFLRSFIVSNKKNIDKNVYKDYLKKYKQVKKWQKIRY